MENEKMVELLKNEDFVKKIVNLKTAEEVQKAFKDEGVDISLEKIGILGDLINKQLAGGELDDNDLAEITGGKTTVGLGTTIIVGGVSTLVGAGIVGCMWGAHEAKRIYKNYKLIHDADVHYIVHPEKKKK